jgi:hypothetical protein
MSSQQRRGERRKKCTRGEFAASSAAMTFDDDTFGVEAFVLLLAVFEGVCFGRGGARAMSFCIFPSGAFGGERWGVRQRRGRANQSSKCR